MIYVITRKTTILDRIIYLIKNFEKHVYCYIVKTIVILLTHVYFKTSVGSEH